MEGRMLVPLGIAFITAILGSTLSPSPLHPCYVATCWRKPSKGASSEESRMVRFLKKEYKKALQWPLARKKGVLITTGALLVTAVILFFTLGRSFLPSFNEGSFTVNVSTLPGISLEESDRMGLLAEEILLSIPEIETTGRKTGRAELDEHAMGINESEIEAPFTLNGRSKEAVEAEMREKLALIPGANIEIGQPISHRIDAMLSGTRANIAIKLFWSDLNHMFELGNSIKSRIEGIEGIADLNVEQQVERPSSPSSPSENSGQVRHHPSEFADIVNVMLAGEVVSQVYEGNRSFDLTLKVNDDSRATAERIKELIVDANGQKVPLGNIAEVVSTTLCLTRSIAERGS